MYSSHSKLPAHLQKVLAGLPLVPLPVPINGVYAWSLLINRPGLRRTVIEETLSPQEKQTAVEFRSAADRQRFVSGRAALRTLLAACTDQPPQEVTFLYHSAGKPSLAGHPDLHFNLAHSGDMILFGISDVGPVGVDVEQMRVVRDLPGLLAMNCTAREAAQVRAHPLAEQYRAFLRLWTLKEAIAKALGAGLALPFNTIEIRLADHERPQLVRLETPVAPGSGWYLDNLPVDGNYLCGLAVKGQPQNP